MTNALPPPGWYADPTETGRVRYWDGGGWTDQVGHEKPVGLDKGPQSNASTAIRGVGAGEVRARKASRMDAQREIREAKQAQRLAEKASKADELEKQRATELADFQAKLEADQAFIELKLSEAVQAASDANFQLELNATNAARAQAKKLGSSQLKATEQRLLALKMEGSLFKDSKFLGTVKGEGYLEQSARQGGNSKIPLTRRDPPLEVRSDRVIRGNQVRPIDEFTSAQVFLDGERQVTYRPTLTRMLLLSPLPGSALLPGLALPKKTLNDMRSAEFQVGGIDWSFRVRISPDQISGPRSLAEQINRLADAKSKAQDPSPGGSAGSVVDQLQKLAELHRTGALTDAEFNMLKESLLG